MKPSRFGYHRVGSVAEAVLTLSAYEGSARLLAGGQSLVPMLNMRLFRPDALVDVNDVPEVQGVDDRVHTVVIGAGTRYSELEASPVVAQRLPLLAQVLPHIGDRQIRNRGTVGGSLSHGDPTAEFPLACLVLGAHVRVTGPAGERTVAVRDLYLDPYSTVLGPLEMLTHVEIPVAGAPAAFVEMCRRHNDFAIVAVGCTGRRDDGGRWRDVRVGLAGVAGTSVLAESVGSALDGSSLDDAAVAEAAATVQPYLDPASDIRASADYRRHVAPVYVRRALTMMRDRAAV